MASSAPRKTRKHKRQRPNRSARAHDVSVLTNFFSNDDQGPTTFPAHLIAQLRPGGFDDRYNDTTRHPSLKDHTPLQIALLEERVRTDVQPHLEKGRIRAELVSDPTMIRPPFGHRHIVLGPPDTAGESSDATERNPLRLIQKGHCVALAHLPSYDAVENVVASHAFNTQRNLPTLGGFAAQFSSCRVSAVCVDTARQRCVMTLSLDRAKDVFFVALHLSFSDGGGADDAESAASTSAPASASASASASGDATERAVVGWAELPDYVSQRHVNLQSHVYFTCACKFLIQS